MEISPLERIAEWYRTSSDGPRGKIAFSSLVNLGKWTPGEDEFPDPTVFEEWLHENLDFFQHLGRAIYVRGMIDYIFAKEGDPKEWDDRLNRNLNMVDSGDLPKELKPLINKVIPNFINGKPEWLEAARTWQDVRNSHLTDEALHDWEDAMMLRSGPPSTY